MLSGCDLRRIIFPRFKEICLLCSTFISPFFKIVVAVHEFGTYNSRYNILYSFGVWLKIHNPFLCIKMNLSI